MKAAPEMCFTGMREISQVADFDFLGKMLLDVFHGFEYVMLLFDGWLCDGNAFRHDSGCFKQEAQGPGQCDLGLEFLRPAFVFVQNSQDPLGQNRMILVIRDQVIVVQSCCQLMSQRFVIRKCMADQGVQINEQVLPVIDLRTAAICCMGNTAGDDGERALRVMAGRAIIEMKVTIAKMAIADLQQIVEMQVVRRSLIKALPCIADQRQDVFIGRQVVMPQLDQLFLFGHLNRNLHG